MVKKISILVIVSFLIAILPNKIAAQESTTPKTDSLPQEKSSVKEDSLLNVYQKKWVALATEGKFDSALYCAKKMQPYVEKTYGKLSDKNGSVLANIIGRTYLELNDDANAFYFYKKGVDIFDTISTFYNTNTNSESVGFVKFKENYALALVDFGIICNRIGAIDNAIALFSRVLHSWKKKPEWFGSYLTALTNLAISYSHIGDYSKARLLFDTLKQAIDAEPKSTDVSYSTISLYNNIAVIYAETGNTKKSLEYIKRAEDVFTVTKFENEYGGAYFEEYIQILINVAESYKNMHYYDSALLKCTQTKRSLLNKKADYSQANILQEEAAIYIEQNKFTKALQLCKQSIRIMDTLPRLPDFYHPTLLNLGSLYQQSGKYVSADSIYRHEINYLHSKGLTSSYYLQQTLMAMCQSLFFENKNKEAADSLLKAGNLAMHVLTENFAGMAETDQMQYTATFESIFDMLNSLLAKDKNIGSDIKKLAFALQIQRKNMVLANQASLLSRLRTSNDTAVATLYSTWLNTKQVLAKQYSLSYSDRGLNTDSLEVLNEVIEKQVSAKGYTSGFTNKTETTAPFLLQNRNTTNIQFVRYNKTGKSESAANTEYGAFIIHGGDTIPFFVRLCSETSLIHLMQAKNGQLQSETQLTQKLYSPSALAAAVLYSLVWKPLNKYLQNTTVINYSPAGLLNNISFHALYDGKNWLVNNYTMHCFSSLADVNNTQTSVEPPKQISLWGNMDYDSSSYSIDTTGSHSEAETISMNADGIKPAEQLKSISKIPLPNFYTDELGAIKKVFAANNISYTGYENSAATEENFKHRSFSIQGVLHISTHGFYTPYNKKNADAQLPGSFIAGNVNPLFRCGLAFAGVNYYWMKGQPKPNHDDGILTGYEVSQLDLHNVQLVTLSACETGLGDITATEGNLGLQRAFKLAGVQKLLVSLWQVPAKQTQQLLTKFYTYWLAGNTPTQALQTAETDMQKAHYPPYYWAGFVLVE